MAIDVAIVLATYYLVLNFRYAGTATTWHAWTADFAVFAGVAVVTHLFVNWLSGVYKIVNRYMSLAQATRVAQAGVLVTALLFILVAIWPLFSDAATFLVPRTVVIAGGAAAAIVMIGARFSYRMLHENTRGSVLTRERVLLVGAGQAADMLIREIQRTPSLGVRVVGLVDDRCDLKNMTIQGFPVLGAIAEVPELVQTHRVTQIIVAIPSASAEQVARIYRLCKPAGVPLKIVPSLADLVSGSAGLRDARDLEIRDLLGRPKLEIDVGAISDFVEGRAVLVTGAGGSIGSELCRQITRFAPDPLVLVDHDESSLYDLHEHLQSSGFRRYVLCPTNILDERKMERLFALHRPRLVLHAAAYKHVPLMELNPDEAVLNNVQGTLLVANMAARYKVERFVNISTDKAVTPRSAMGATKRVGELVVRMLSEKHPETAFASVRFGNVLGSQGSVIPVFRRQIEIGGPVVITHPDMTRYFMLIEEAVQLVLQAAIMMDEDPFDRAFGLNTFLLEMGNPVSIVELAQRMIDFYWKDQNRSIGVEFSGLRPGEKLDEQLIYPFEQAVPTSHPLIMRVCARPGVAQNGDGDHFEYCLNDLLGLAREHGDRLTITRSLMHCVPEYRPPKKPVIGKLPLEKPAALM